jgi:hypothetical protein
LNATTRMTDDIQELTREIKDIEEAISKSYVANLLIEGPSKWEWWRVKKGEWENLSATGKMEWLTGLLDKMAKEYGVHSDTSVMDKESGDISVTVYGLKSPRISESCKAELASYHKLGDEEKDEAFDKMESDGPLEWLYFFEDVYPSSHLIYVHYSTNVEAYGIFCETYKDMLDVVHLVLGAS